MKLRHTRMRTCRRQRFSWLSITDTISRSSGAAFLSGRSWASSSSAWRYAGRPVALRSRRWLDRARLPRVHDGAKDACSFLYGASARAAFALGFKRIGTYILGERTWT